MSGTRRSSRWRVDELPWYVVLGGFVAIVAIVLGLASAGGMGGVIAIVAVLAAVVAWVTLSVKPSPELLTKHDSALSHEVHGDQP